MRSSIDMDGLFKHGEILGTVKSLLEKHKDFKIISSWIDSDTNKPSGFIVSNNRTNEEMFVGAKNKAYSRASINLGAYNYCVKNGMNIGIMYFKNKDGSQFNDSKQRMYIFKIDDVNGNARTSINSRLNGSVDCQMMNFDLSIAKRYSEYINEKMGIVPDKKPGIYVNNKYWR